MITGNHAHQEEHNTGVYDSKYTRRKSLKKRNDQKKTNVISFVFRDAVWAALGPQLMLKSIFL